MREANSKARRAAGGQTSNRPGRLRIDLVFSRRDEPGRQQGRGKQGDGRSGQSRTILCDQSVAGGLNELGVTRGPPLDKPPQRVGQTCIGRAHRHG